ncbi:hypothetical protein BJX62DRAFT_193767 [Aspergillus germanicus]
MSATPTPTPTPRPSPGPLPEAVEAKRIELITAIESQLDNIKLDQSSWAALWLADIAVLQKHATSFDKEKFALMSGYHPAASIAKNWSARTHSEKNDKPKTKKTRSKTTPELVLERDNSRCLLTKAGEPVEIAHIYPFCMGKREGTQQQIRFWTYLELFWSKDRVAAWKAAVLGSSGTEVIHNMMALRSDVHELWGKARFALKPGELSSDGKKLQVKFYWLPAYEWTPYRPLFPPPDDGKYSELSVNGAKLIDITNLTVLCSGAGLVFETTDPVDHPLPSTAILDMQWVLARLQALSGAAEADECAIWPDRDSPGAGFLSSHDIDDDDGDEDDDNNAPPPPPSPPPPRQRASFMLENIP